VGCANAQGVELEAIPPINGLTTKAIYGMMSVVKSEKETKLCLSVLAAGQKLAFTFCVKEKKNQ
jgi:hypothetical protein